MNKKLPNKNALDTIKGYSPNTSKLTIGDIYNYVDNRFDQTLYNQIDNFNKIITDYEKLQGINKMKISLKNTVTKCDATIRVNDYISIDELSISFSIVDNLNVIKEQMSVLIQLNSSPQASFSEEIRTITKIFDVDNITKLVVATLNNQL